MDKDGNFKSTEFEAQILDIDPIEFRKKVKGMSEITPKKNKDLLIRVFQKN